MNIVRISRRNLSVKAISYEKFGGPEVLKISERKLAPIGENEVRVRVEYSALNRADLVQREGKYPNQKSPLPLGLECSGIVEEVGSKANLKKGDKVMALLNGGGHAQAVNVPANFCMKIPSDLSLAVAAAIPETFLTAFQLIHLVGNAEKGSGRSRRSRKFEL